MALCDVSRLHLITPADAEAFKQRLALAGVTAQALHPITSLCELLPDAFRGPIRRWHLRRIEGARGALMRAFFFGDPVPREELAAALGGPELLGRFLEAGLLSETGSTEAGGRVAGGVVCPLRLNLINDFWIFTDDLSQGEDAVMGAGATTGSLIQAAWPSRPVSSVLDMGCGAGTAALLLGRQAERSLGVDISERSLILSRFNALLAGLANVEFLESNFFSALGQQTFDLIVSQPPFVARPSTTPGVTFLHGGDRGDELALALLAQVPEHLAPGGRAVMLVDWPKYDDVSVTERIRSVVKSDVPLDLLVLLGPSKSLDEHITFYAIMLADTRSGAFEDYVLSHREHLERMQIKELRLALIVLRRTEKKPWTRLILTSSQGSSEPTGAHIERLLAASDLLNQNDEALLAARLVVPEGARFIEQDERSMRVELPVSRLVAPIVTSRAGADLVLEVGRSATVAEAVEKMFERLPQLGAGGPGRLLAGVRAALTSGLLEVPEGE